MTQDYKPLTLEEAIIKSLTRTLVGAWVYPVQKVLGGSVNEPWRIDLLIHDDFEYLVFTIDFNFGQSSAFIDWTQKSKIDNNKYTVFVLNGTIGVDIKSTIHVLHRIEDITGNPIDSRLWDLIGECDGV